MATPGQTMDAMASQWTGTPWYHNGLEHHDITMDWNTMASQWAGT